MLIFFSDAKNTKTVLNCRAIFSAGKVRRKDVEMVLKLPCTPLSFDIDYVESVPEQDFLRLFLLLPFHPRTISMALVVIIESLDIRHHE